MQKKGMRQAGTGFWEQRALSFPKITSGGRGCFGSGFLNRDSEIFSETGTLLGAQVEGPGISSALLVCRKSRHLVVVNVFGVKSP